jgi:ribosomal protein L9
MYCHHHNQPRREGYLLNQDETTTTNNLHECEVSGSNGIYKLTWPQLHITAHIDRIKESSDHEVKAELRFTSGRPTSSGHLRAGRLNLTSPAARNTFAKALLARDADVDWDLVLEQVSRAVLQEWREGNPVVELDGTVDVLAQSNKWLIEPIIQLNNPTLIYGPGSTGKSWFGQYVAVLADQGMSAAGFNVEPCTVLYLDWETDQVELGSRVTMIRSGLGLSGKSHILYKAMNQGLSADIERIREICLEHSVGLVVIDSLGSACMGEPESAEVVLRTFASIRSLGISSLCIDHTNKEGALFGSVYKFNSARQVFEAKKSQQEDEDKIVLGLFHKKANNSKLLRPLGFELGFQENKTMTITRQDVKETELEEHMRVSDRIGNALARFGKMTASEIAEAINKEESHVRKELSNGKRSGRFIHLADHKWALPARLEDEVARIYQQELEGEI